MSFHVLTPKPGTPCEALRAMAQRPEFALSVDPNCRFAGPGAEVSYELSYANLGEMDATGVVLESALPDGVTLVAESISGGGSYDSATHTITWQIGNIPTHSDAQTLGFAATLDDGLAEDTDLLVYGRAWSQAAGVLALAEGTTTVGLPHLQSVSPLSTPAGQVNVTLAGSKLDPAASVGLRHSSGSRVPVPIVEVAGDGRSLNALAVLDATDGSYDVTVTNPGGGQSTIAGAITIDGVARHNLSIDLVGPSQVPHP